MSFALASIQFLPLSIVRSCLSSEARTECLPSAKMGIEIQQVGGSCNPNEFKFALDPDRDVARPNPWNTPLIARVLTHKYGSGDSYPSTYQATDRQDVTLRPRFRFLGTAKVGGSVAAVRLWFRAIDPPDTAPYVVQANDARNNDNKDTFSGGKGILMTPTCSDVSSQSTCAALNGNVLATTSAPDGIVEVVLETTDRYAGDNYQILASFAAPGLDGKFPCEATTPSTCAKSAPITAWKRIYIEKHGMYRSGAFVAADVPAGSTEVPVTDRTVFAEGQSVQFIHGNPFPSTSTTPSSPIMSESATIATATQADPRPGVYALPGRRRWAIRLTRPLNNAYTKALNDTMPYTADGIGVGPLFSSTCVTPRRTLPNSHTWTFRRSHHQNRCSRQGRCTIVGFRTVLVVPLMMTLVLNPIICTSSAQRRFR